MYIPDLRKRVVRNDDARIRQRIGGHHQRHAAVTVFADSGKELQKRLEKRENFPAELFSNLELWVDGAVVSDRNCSVYVPFVAPISAVMETYSIPLTPELTEGEREYIERLICKELGLDEGE